jgi:GNAT superfamily N-acetyltransferase
MSPEFHVPVIRPATVQDVPELAVLLGELGYPCTEDFARQKISLLAGPYDTILVAVAGGAVAGVISVHLMPIFHMAGMLGKITALVVAHAYRGTGCGRLLVQAAHAFATERGVMRIEVVSGNHRPDAHRFYRRLGYVATDQTRFIYEHRAT